MDRNSVQTRARGVMLGMACGDALGATLEFMGSREIASRYGTLRDLVGGGWLSLRPGETTDDTAMALDLARSLAARSGLVPEDVAARWVAWMRSGPKDIGGTVAAALSLIADGTPWTEAGELVDEKQQPLGGALGNGSLMRCAPIAIRYVNDEQSLIRASLDSSRITHANPICQWSTAAANLMIAGLLRGETEGLVGKVAAQIPEPEVSERLLGAHRLTERELRTGGMVLDTLESAVWALGNSGSLEAAVVAAANLGGDADTRAAVTGAMAGAVYGEEAIPERWLDVLEGRDELVQLADELLRAGLDD